MKHSNGFGVAEKAKPKEQYIEKIGLSFFKWSRMGERKWHTRYIFLNKKYGF